ncbi:MAG: DUF4215 domain-containing protein [Candidatus Binatia bacterium]
MSRSRSLLAGRSLFLGLLLAYGALACSPVWAVVLDFEQFEDGHVLLPGDLGPGITLSFTSHELEDLAIVFDSGCDPGSCHPEFDDELRTPGYGLGNAVPLHKLMTLEEEEDQDHQAEHQRSPHDAAEDTITLTFEPPLKLLSLVLVNVEHDDAGTRVRIIQSTGGIQVVRAALLGDNSVQTLQIPNPQLASSVTLFLNHEVGVDNIVLSDGCGDGALDPSEQCDDGNLEDGDCCSSSCTAEAAHAPCDDGDPCTPSDECDGGGVCVASGSTCGNGTLDANCGEHCDDGNLADGDCCNSTCSFEPEGVPCTDDNDVCTFDLCSADGVCLHPANSGPCDDADACTTSDSCVGGSCIGGTPLDCSDGNPCTDDRCDSNLGCQRTFNDLPCDNGNPFDSPDSCIEGVCVGQGGCQGSDANCDDSNPCTDDLCLASGACDHKNNSRPCDDSNACTTADTCANGTCSAGPPLDCDDGNSCTNDNCDAADGCVHSNNNAPCDDGLFCTGVDSCDQGTCLHSGDPCIANNQCNDGCDESAGDCLNPAGSPCDDGNICTTTDVCDGAGLCTGSGSTCGDGSVQESCGEQCDPPDETQHCSSQCAILPFCGDNIVDPDEQCDDGNGNTGDGCSDCKFEQGELNCFEGSGPQPGIGAKRIVFQSSADFTGGNPDGNQEIFVFDRKVFRKLVKSGAELASAIDGSMVQLTDTISATPGVDNLNETPTINGSGRFVAFVSNADLTGGNPDHNKEVFHLDRKLNQLTQVTDTTAGDNLHPNLRASRGKLLFFDSAADLVPGRCVGGKDNLGPCTSDADCRGVICGKLSLCPDAPARCGNDNGNREIFVWRRKLVRPSKLKMRQLTEADSGISVVGRSISYRSSASAFSSTADLLGNNPSGASGRSIFRVRGRTASLTQITQPLSAGGFISESPSQGKKRFVAFASDADLVPGSNTDGNVEVFIWDERAAQGSAFVQVTDTSACNNASPSLGSRARLLAIQSTCDLLGNGTNRGQSIFVYDRKRQGFVGALVLRGPGGADSSRPSVTRRVRIVTFEADPGGSSANQVCVFRVRKEAFEGVLVTPGG